MKYTPYKNDFPESTKYFDNEPIVGMTLDPCEEQVDIVTINKRGAKETYAFSMDEFSHTGIGFGLEKDCLFDIYKPPVDYKKLFQSSDEIAKTYSCDFCHGQTTNDYRGNCAACGAPREKEEEFPEPLPTSRFYR